MNVKALNELGAKVTQMEASFCMSSVHWSSAWSIYNYWVGYLMIFWQTSELAPSLLIQSLPQSHPSTRSKELRQSTPFAWGKSGAPGQSLRTLRDPSDDYNLLVWGPGAFLCLLFKLSQGLYCSSLSLNKGNKGKKEKRFVGHEMGWCWLQWPPVTPPMNFP